METTVQTMFENTVKYSGEDIFIQPFCDFFCIQYKNQIKAINSNPLLKRSVCKKRSMLLFGDERARLCLSKEGFITWILQLRSQIVHPDLQEKLMQYQSLIFDFMFGSIKREEKAKLQYSRMIKLRRLKTKIVAEIARCEVEVHSYLDGKFLQSSFDFSKKKRLT